MEDLVSLCKRRGFIYPASEIYGGINGFWDYGPLGILLKNNLRDRWWRDMVLMPPVGPDGKRVQIVGLDSSIIQNPKAWVASGHVAGFNDPMVDDKETKQRFRADHLQGVYRVDNPTVIETQTKETLDGRPGFLSEGRSLIPNRTIVASICEEAAALLVADKKTRKQLGIGSFEIVEPFFEPRVPTVFAMADFGNGPERTFVTTAYIPLRFHPEKVPSPFTNNVGTLTEPRAFNLMFSTKVGATAAEGEDNTAYLRPETAQGIFLNYKNVVDTTRVRVPFGIAQVGKAFRNEVTPRNFIFRSREFEQMEMEWFCHPAEAPQWFEFWKRTRLDWWTSLGVDPANLIMRQHEQDELSHYAKVGCGTADVEYRYPFTAPGYGELEGIAHRTDFDLRAHDKESGAKLQYFDQSRNEHYFPHVIEPASGLSRGVLVLLCEAFTPDESRASKVFMKFPPALAPIKAAVYPLVNKDGMPEAAEKLHETLLTRFATRGMIEYDPKQSIGKRYARMDEAGCPYCFTIDGETLTDQTVTVRHRDTQAQERIGIDAVPGWLGERLGA
jgi:glycyl-tRNA synthetase